MNQSPTYCQLSHLSLAVQNRGDVCVCNKNTQSFGGEKAWHLNEVGLDKMWNNGYRKIVVAKLDQGIRIPSCSACWNDEDAGIESSRQKFNKRLADVEPLTTQPRVLIIKPSNVCNMMCRTCQPSTSTSLYQDFYKLDSQRGEFSGTFKEYTQQFEVIREGFNRDNELIWETFGSWIENLVFIDIYGGEPMLAPAMWTELINAADRGVTTNTSLQMHTNGMIWNQKYIDCLLKYKSVHIGVSIDSANPEHLKYVRHGADPDKIFTNLQRYINLAKTHENVAVSISYTVSMYNIWYLLEELDALHKFGVRVNLNIVHAPEHYDFRHLPQTVKQELIAKLKNYSGPYQSYVNTVLPVLHHTVPGCDIYYPKFLEEVKMLDDLRNQSFKEIMPEYYDKLVYAGQNQTN